MAESEMSNTEPRVIRVGLLGCGIVGSATCRLLAAHAEEIRLRTGCSVEISRVAVRNLSKDRDVDVPADRFTNDAHMVVKDPEIDIVVEVIGGIEPSRTLILEAIDSGKQVVTANKELISSLGGELIAAAEASGVDLLFEASVGGGIPIVRPLEESLAGEKVRSVIGILNGTTNYVLTRMTEEGLSLHDAVAEAQELGYAERDPSADVEGFDAAAKTAILASIAFDTKVTSGDVYREGISAVTQLDIALADRLGYVIKLLAVARLEGGEVEARVHPAMIPKSHPLASVRESFNAVFVEGNSVGELMFYGRGAGGGPTATSVVGDVVAAVRHLSEGGKAHRPHRLLDLPVRAFDEIRTQYYLLFEVADQPGVLAQIAAVFGAHEVSIAGVWQEGQGDQAQLVIITHRARERDLQETLHELRGLDVVVEIRSVLRVESEGA